MVRLRGNKGIEGNKKSMKSLDEYARIKLEQIAAAGQMRAVLPTVRGAGMTVDRGEGALVSFSDNDYLGLSQHPATKEAAAQAAMEFGSGGGASRLITGSYPLLHELEAALADWKKAEDAVVFGSGYMANIGIVPTLVGPGDLILIDQLSHNCLHAGATQSGARTIAFAHNDCDDLERHLKEQREKHEKCLILTDGVFSMDGDLAPVSELGAIARKHDAWLMTDDAHGLGVLGGGRGSVFETGSPDDVPLQMGTLSKAIGSYGGYACASKAVCDLIRNRARSLIYTTSLPPAATGAALAALSIIRTSPDLCAQPREKAQRFATTLGLPVPESQIVPVILGDENRTMVASAKLAEEGFLVSGIRPPTVPAGTSRLRFSFSATHRDEDVDRLANLVKELVGS